jgi:hypothetical protein
MIEDPDRWAPGFVEAGASSVTFHAEAVTAPIHLPAAAGRRGRAGRGSARLPRWEPYLELLSEFRHAVGDDGGTGIRRSAPSWTSACPRSVAPRTRSDALAWTCGWQVDGGVSEHTIERCAEAGANVFVAGPRCFTAADGRRPGEPTPSSGHRLPPTLSPVDKRVLRQRVLRQRVLRQRVLPTGVSPVDRRTAVADLRGGPLPGPPAPPGPPRPGGTGVPLPAGTDGCQTVLEPTSACSVVGNSEPAVTVRDPAAASGRLTCGTPGPTVRVRMGGSTPHRGRRAGVPWVCSVPAPHPRSALGCGG